VRKVYVYARFSSTMQKKESIKAQLRAIKQYCKMRGYKIAGIYIDEAQSATTDKRPEFQKMMSDCQKGGVYAVVVHKLDRFSRNVNDFVTYKLLLEKNDIKLISVIEQIEGTPEGKLMEGVISAMNEFYSGNLGREVQKGKMEIAYKGLHTGGLPPYGYDIVDKKYVINAEESKAVKIIFNMFICDYSYQQIADKLNECGYRTKKGNKFNKNSFSSIIENVEKYVGVYIYNKAAPKYSDGTRNSHKHKDDKDIIRLKDGMPSIISESTYIAVLEKIALNKALSGRYHTKRYYLLNGLIKCGECDRAYTGNTSCAGRNKTEYSTYRCGGYREDTCNNKAVNIDYLNDYVLTLLTDIIFDDNNYKSIMSSVNKKIAEAVIGNSNQIISIKNKLIQVDASLNKLTDSLLIANDSQAIIDKISELENKRLCLDEELNRLENYKPVAITADDVDTVKRKFKKYLLKNDLVLCRKFIREFVQEIVVYRESVEVVLKTSAEHKKEDRKTA